VKEVRPMLDLGDSLLAKSLNDSYTIDLGTTL
jgi:hypothetical protein